MSTALTTPDQMTLQEFLAWDAPGPGQWQLIDGVPVAMAPASRAHGRLQTVIAGLIDSHLEASGSPCVALTNPGIVPAFQASRNFCIPDLAVTCAETDNDPAGLHHPVLVIEILSPSNHAETWRNVRAYMLIDSVREILVIHTASVRVDLLQRRADGVWPEDVTPITQGAFPLASIGLNVLLSELYRRSGVG
ncbi:MAG TPA: Uma2 family endonuclease [Acetobacteraceae bacterium]|jgi:Uma2 family endonuclease|nr:Uma2 family endonuclease [Acetobacteraceae bacterium]